RGVPQVVDPDDHNAVVEEPPIEEAAQIVTADAAETVDRHTVGHVFLHYLADRSSRTQVISSVTATTPSTARVRRTAISAVLRRSARPRSVTRPSVTNTSIVAGMTQSVRWSTSNSTSCRIAESERR